MRGLFFLLRVLNFSFNGVQRNTANKKAGVTELPLLILLDVFSKEALINESS